MYYKNDKGELIGVLNDYDLSSLASGLGPQGNERTGTVPFMALDLLTEEGQRGKVEHLYHHDLESFMWILPWVVLRYKDGKLLTSGRPLDAWATKDALTVYEKKTTFLHDFLLLDRTRFDPLMWSLTANCLNVLRSKSSRRLDVLAEQQLYSDDGCGIPDIERDDMELLNLFKRTRVWIELSK
jgi:hypothetical protein